LQKQLGIKFVRDQLQLAPNKHDDKKREKVTVDFLEEPSFEQGKDGKKDSDDLKKQDNTNKRKGDAIPDVTEKMKSKKKKKSKSDKKDHTQSGKNNDNVSAERDKVYVTIKNVRFSIC